jgi:hypothetical protein
LNKKSNTSLPSSFFVLLTLFSTEGFAFAASTDSQEQVRRAITAYGSIEKMTQASAARMSESLPQRIDSSTTVLAVFATGKTLNYSVKIDGTKDLSQSQIRDLKDRMFSEAAPAVCSGPTASVVINIYGSEYKYTFYSSERKYLFSYTLDASTCQNYR